MSHLALLQIQRVPRRALPNDLVAYAARDIQAGAVDLMRAVEQSHTNSEALALFQIASTLRQELDRVVVAALEMADANTGK